jgi:hypothetical protein
MAVGRRMRMSAAVSAGFSGNTGVLHLWLHLLRKVPRGGIYG